MNLFAIDYNVISLEFQNIFVLFRNNDFYKYLCFPTKTLHTYKITKVEGKYNGLVLTINFELPNYYKL